VNPTDTNLRSGIYRDHLGGRPGPFIPGADAAGVVNLVGAGTPFEVGDEVVAIAVPTGPRGGTYADEIVVPSASVVRLPAGVDMIAGSTLLMNGLTARLALDSFGLSAGDAVAVLGAAGAFGGYVVQLAKADRLRVIADAAATDESLVRKLGADDVVTRGSDVAQRIRALVPEGVGGLADGAVLDELVLPAIRDAGTLATVRGWSGPTERDITVYPIRVFQSAARTDILERLRGWAEDGTITLRVAHTFPPTQAAAAHRMLEGGGVRGRIVLDFTA
jgi:NADPH:quinone reductase-like Zn-dependent oxidoreductase